VCLCVCVCHVCVCVCVCHVCVMCVCVCAVLVVAGCGVFAFGLWATVFACSVSCEACAVVGAVVVPVVQCKLSLAGKGLHVGIQTYILITFNTLNCICCLSAFSSNSHSVSLRHLCSLSGPSSNMAGFASNKCFAKALCCTICDVACYLFH
jgi:hypothetical protein